MNVQSFACVAALSLAACVVNEAPPRAPAPAPVVVVDEPPAPVDEPPVDEQLKEIALDVPDGTRSVRVRLDGTTRAALTFVGEHASERPLFESGCVDVPAGTTRVVLQLPRGRGGGSVSGSYDACD